MVENARMDSGLTGSYAVSLSTHITPAKVQFDSQVHKGESAGRPPMAPGNPAPVEVSEKKQ